MKFISTVTCLFLSCALSLSGQDIYRQQRAAWLQIAERCKPKLVNKLEKPVQLTTLVKDEQAFQGWKAVRSGSIDSLYQVSFESKNGVIVDFGKHLTGYVSIVLSPLQKTPDAPIRLKLTAGEVPSELATSFDNYQGGLSRAWLQDEILTVMNIPDTITIARRLAFRYVKIELLTVPQYTFRISDISCTSVTSASLKPMPLAVTTPPVLQEIDKVGLNTLKDCMQTVYEDGPKRDQRLWIGDLYLESLANEYSFKAFNLTKRCLYLLAGLSAENGYLHATVFEHPVPHPQANQFLLEYALLFNATLNEYYQATGDQKTVQDLWPVALKQLDIVHTYLKSNGLMDYERANKEWWLFFDWKDNLNKEVALQGISIFALKQTWQLANSCGKTNDVSDLPILIKKMSKAAQTCFYDKKSGLYVGTGNKQLSYASQIWMVLSGVAKGDYARNALNALTTAKDVCYPGTPYLYHYYIQALISSGLAQEAKNALSSYWGGMIRKGADTFWEAYDPVNDFISPYNFFPINSYCHAWSCTPVYFIRKYPEIFQK